MFRPESDWTGQERFGVNDFYIEAMATMGDAQVDVRHFNWVLPCTGVFSPEKHYLDYSLDSQPRRSKKTERPAMHIPFIQRRRAA